jgi:hypothetical protein
VSIGELNQWTGVVTDVATVIAIGVGALWTYFHYFYRRTYSDRLNIDVSAKLIVVKEGRFLEVESVITNAGLTRLFLEPDACVIRLSRFPASGYFADEPAPYRAIRCHAATFRTFGDGVWVEAGENLADRDLFALPTADAIAWEVTTMIGSSRGSAWTATVVVPARDGGALDAP